MLISITAFGQKESELKAPKKNNENDLVSIDLKSDTTKVPIMTDEAIIFCTEFEKPIPSTKDLDLPPPNNLPVLQIPDSTCISPDELPTLAMFSHIEDYEIRSDSSRREMLEIIYKNIKYPPITRCTAIEGTVVIGFIIEKDGTMTNVHIRRDIGGGMGEEAMRVVKLLPKFSPAMKDGKAVRFLYYVPVRFSSFY